MKYTATIKDRTEWISRGNGWECFSDCVYDGNKMDKITLDFRRKSSKIEF